MFSALNYAWKLALCAVLAELRWNGGRFPFSLGQWTRPGGAMCSGWRLRGEWGRSVLLRELRALCPSLLFLCFLWGLSDGECRVSFSLRASGCLRREDAAL